MDAGDILTALARVGGPGMVGGFLLKWLEPFSAEDIYKMATDHKDKNVWEIIPADWKDKLKGYQEKIGILDNLSVEWAIQELIKGKRSDLASLIANVPEVAQFIDKLIHDLKEGVAK